MAPVHTARQTTFVNKYNNKKCILQFFLCRNFLTNEEKENYEDFKTQEFFKHECLATQRQKNNYKIKLYISFNITNIGEVDNISAFYIDEHFIRIYWQAS